MGRVEIAERGPRREGFKEEITVSGGVEQVHGERRLLFIYFLCRVHDLLR